MFDEGAAANPRLRLARGIHRGSAHRPLQGNTNTATTTTTTTATTTTITTAAAAATNSDNNNDSNTHDNNTSNNNNKHSKHNDTNLHTYTYISALPPRRRHLLYIQYILCSIQSIASRISYIGYMINTTIAKRHSG